MLKESITDSLVFRAWSHFDKQFVYFSLHDGKPQGYFGGLGPAEMCLNSVDKNNEAIYEGDIIKCTQSADHYGSDERDIVLVAGWDIVRNFDDEHSGGPDGDTRYLNIEVIGNVHETPEYIPGRPVEDIVKEVNETAGERSETSEEYGDEEESAHEELDETTSSDDETDAEKDTNAPNEESTEPTTEKRTRRGRPKKS